MTCTLPRFSVGLTLLLALGWTLPAADLSEYRTVETAVTTIIKKTKKVSPGGGQPGYLGVLLTQAGKGSPTVAQVSEASPAAAAGLLIGDQVLQIDGITVNHPDVAEGLLLARTAGEAVKLSLRRKGKPLELTVTLAAVSRPRQLASERVSLGVRLSEPKDEEGTPITQVGNGSPAEKAGLKSGDLLVKVEGQPVSSPTRLADALGDKKPGDTITVVYRRGGKELEAKIELVQETAPIGKGGQGGWDNRTLRIFKKDVYRLAVVCVEYPDVEHNVNVTTKDWEAALFSSKEYSTTSATGQKVFGSMNDYYQELSYGKLKVEGKAFDWVKVSKKRADYSQGTGTVNKSALLVEALDKLYERDGADALKGYDGIFFLYAGARVSTTRGGLYWPHRASFTHKGKSWPYFIVNEGGQRMSNISVISHEFGHMLGLPDLYARPELPGSEGAGGWCAMSNQNPNGRPQHFSAWCKEQLGWIQPAVIDPTVPQKLVLSPIKDSNKECFKVLLRPDGSEYLLLENRRKNGFDQDLPAEGLLIWRVVQNKPILEESHGVDGPAGPRSFLSQVPYPSEANNAFTPYTTPSSRSQLGGGLPVYITNIRKLPDGRVTFHIGYKYF